MNVFRSGLLAGVSALVIVAVAAPVQAQSNKKSPQQVAEDYYKKAQAQYDLGNWQKAIEFYKRSYEAFPASALLFNIAQSYRQWGNCEQALFFYRRYLANNANAPNKKVVEDLIKDQEKACAGRDKDPTTSLPPDNKNPNTTGHETTGHETTGHDTTGTGHDTTAHDTTTNHDVDNHQTTDKKGDDDDSVALLDDDDDDVSGNVSGGISAAPAAPELFAAHVALGGSFVRFGDPNLQSNALAAFAVGGGYPLQVGPVGLELGGMVTYSPIPWDNGNMQSGTASLTGLLADVGVLYPIPSFPRLSVRVDVGLGAQLFGGLTEDGVVFLDPGNRATGTLATFHFRGAVGAEYAVTKNIVVDAFPAVFGYSPRGDLRSTISSVTRFELLVGAGYRM